MKKKIIFRLLAFAAIAIAALACVRDILSVTFTNFKANAEETVIVKTEFRNTEANCTNTYLVFAALFPANLKAAETAKVTFTTENFQSHGYSDLVDEEMVVMEATELEKMSSKPWATALMSKFGTMGNYGDFEWVVWRSKDKYNLATGDDEGPHSMADVKLVFKNEARNVKFNFAVMYAVTCFGLDDEYSKYASPFTVMYETTGGEGREDYTVPKLVTLTPLKFTFEDIMGVDFMSKLTGVNTALAGETDVYLLGKVILNDGSELAVSSPSADNRMTRAAENLYKKYIYPRQFFNVPASKKISKMFFWFSNADGTKIEDASGNLYEQYETGTPLK